MNESDGALQLEIHSGYISHFFTNETGEGGERVAVLHSPLIVIHNHELSDEWEIVPLMEYALQCRKPLLFVGGGVTGCALSMLVKNADLGRYPFAAVKVAGGGESRRKILDDIATVTGGLVIDDNLGVPLRYLSGHPRRDVVLGAAKMVRIEKAKTTFFGGAGPLMAERSTLPVNRKRGGGRHAKYKWSPVLAELRKCLDRDGAPGIGDGGQARLERFVVSLFPTDDCPAPSTIREKVRHAIEKFRRDLHQ